LGFVRVRIRFASLFAVALATGLLLSASLALAGAVQRINAAATAYHVQVTPPGESPVVLHIEEVGAGPPVVLLHGIGGSGYSFRHLAPVLAATHRVVLIDLKGFGASEKPFDENYGADAQARLVLAFLRARGLSQVTLLGHSFGGAIALLATLDAQARAPGRIARLVLLNAPAYPQPMNARHRFLTLPVLPYLALTAVPPLLTARAALETTARVLLPANDDDAAMYAAPLYSAAGRHALIATTRAMARLDPRAFMARYTSIRQPTLLIWCRHDPTVPLANGERLARDLPRARLAVLERCEHAPAEEQPRETAALIRGFLASR
jgi:pimeloyl-ACP methyl ester carboxylesterase